MRPIKLIDNKVTGWEISIFLKIFLLTLLGSVTINYKYATKTNKQQ